MLINYKTKKPFTNKELQKIIDFYGWNYGEINDNKEIYVIARWKIS